MFSADLFDIEAPADCFMAAGEAGGSFSLRQAEQHNPMLMVAKTIE